MLITNFKQIKQLFDIEEKESQYIDYKRDLYVIQKDQTGADKKKNLDKYELLKDVGAFLNADGGSIVLGIKDDATTGAPRGKIEEAGILCDSMPNKYEENIERLICSGILPISRVDIRIIANELEKSKFFLVINVPVQYFPLFSVNRGSEYIFYVRRGRNIGWMEPREIEDRILNFSKKTQFFSDKVLELSSDYHSESLSPVFSSYPLTPLCIQALDYKDQLRGIDSWELDKSRSYRVTINETNFYPQAIFEGIELSLSGESLQLHDDGFIVWKSSNLNKEKIKIENEGGLKISISHKMIEPLVFRTKILNFVRFCTQMYHAIGYLGDYVVDVKLLGCKKLLLTSDNYNYNYLLTLAKSNDGYLKHEMLNDEKGPKKTEKKEISVQIRLSTLKYTQENLSELDQVIKKQVLDRFWRAYGFDESENF